MSIHVCLMYFLCVVRDVINANKLEVSLLLPSSNLKKIDLLITLLPTMQHSQPYNTSKRRRLRKLPLTRRSSDVFTTIHT